MDVERELLFFLGPAIAWLPQEAEPEQGHRRLAWEVIPANIGGQ